MTFATPLWLLAGALLCGLEALLFLWLDRRQHRALKEFASPHLLTQLTASVSVRRRWLKRGLILFALGCFCIALARPQAGFRWEETHQKTTDILFAVDTSKSMLTPDVAPNRLTRAKMAVVDLAARLDGDRLGLIAFAGDAFLQCPLTLDADAFRTSVEALDTHTIPRGGTNISSAILTAQDALHNETSETGHGKILVLFSDGEDLEGSAVEAAREAAKDGLKIYTIGVGTAAGDLIPVPDESGGTEFVRDPSGQLVRSRLDEAMLRKIAEATGGSYQPLGARAEGIGTLFQIGLAHIARDQNGTRMERMPREQFAWPLALGLIALLLEPLLGSRRPISLPHAPQPNPPPFIHVRRARPAAKVALLFLACAGALHASPQAGEKAFDQGNFPKAEQEYSQAAATDPQQPALQFNLGSAAYKNDQFDQASGAFEKSLHTNDLTVQQRAYYNLGDAQYRLGQKTEQTNKDQTMQAWKQAIANYESALKLNPNDSDARYNRDFVKKKLDQLQKEKEQEKQNQSNSQNQPNPQNQPSSNKDKDSSSNPSQPQKQNSQNQGPSQLPPQEENQNPDKNSSNPTPGSSPNPPQPNPPENKSGNEPKPNSGNGQNENQKQNPNESVNQNGSSSEKSNGQPSPSSQQPRQAAPGQMTPEEAKSLLDSERGEEATLLPGSGKQAQDEQPPEKDW